MTDQKILKYQNKTKNLHGHGNINNSSNHNNSDKSNNLDENSNKNSYKNNNKIIMMMIIIAVIIIMITKISWNFLEFLDFHLKPLMQSGLSYIRDSGNFIDKMKRIGKVPEGSFLVTVDVVGLYPSIPRKDGILALKSKLEEQTSSKIPTNDLVKLAEFVLKNNFFLI